MMARWEVRRVTGTVHLPDNFRAKPGEVLALYLAGMVEANRMPFLAHLEQKAKRQGDLEMLREIRAYRVLRNP